jgi:peroxiredoxin
VRAGRYILCALACAAFGAASAQTRIPVHFQAVTLGGDSLHVGAGKRSTVVAVFATWCRSCKDELAELGRLARDLSGRPVDVVAVSVDPIPASALRRFIAGRGVTFPVVHDSSATIARQLGSVGVPETFLIGGDGRVVWHLRGPLDAAAAARLRRAIPNGG